MTYMHLVSVTIYPHGVNEHDDPIQKDSFCFSLSFISGSKKQWPKRLDDIIDSIYLKKYPEMSYGVHYEQIKEAVLGAYCKDFIPQDESLLAPCLST